MATVEGAPPIGKGGAVVGHKVGKTPKPDDNKHRANLAAFDKQISTYLDQIQKLTKEIDRQSVGKEDFLRKKEECMRMLDEVRGELSLLEGERASILGKMDNHRVAREGLKSQSAKFRQKLGYSTAEEIDARINELEREIVLNPNSLKEEKKKVAEIEKLKQNRDMVTKRAMLMSKVEKQNEDTYLPLRDKLKLISEKTYVLIEKRKKLTLEWKKVSAERQVIMEPVKDLITEKRGLQDKMSLVTKERRKCLDEFNNSYTIWKKELIEIREQGKAEVKKQKELKELLNQREELIKVIEYGEEPPQDALYNLCKQTLQYTQKLIQDTGDGERGGEKDKGQEKEQQKNQNTELGTLVLPKHKREVEYFIPPTHVSKKKR